MPRYTSGGNFWHSKHDVHFTKAINKHCYFKFHNHVPSKRGLDSIRSESVTENDRLFNLFYKDILQSQNLIKQMFYFCCPYCNMPLLQIMFNLQKRTIQESVIIVSIKSMQTNFAITGLSPPEKHLTYINVTYNEDQYTL